MPSIRSSRLGQAPEEGIKAPVHASTSTNIALTGLVAGTIPGYTITAGERILVRSQTDATENGIYIASSGAWARSNDWNGVDDVANGQLILDSNASLLYQTIFSGTFVFGSTTTTFPNFQDSDTDGSLSTTIITDESYQLAFSDMGKHLVFNTTEGTLVDVMVGLGVGFNCEFSAIGNGKVTLLESGVTLNSADGQTGTRCQYSVISLQAYQEDVFIVGGDSGYGAVRHSQRSTIYDPVQTISLSTPSNSTAIGPVTWIAFEIPEAEINNITNVLMVEGTNVLLEIWGILDGIPVDTGITQASMSDGQNKAFTAITTLYDQLFVVLSVPLEDANTSAQITVT